MLFRALCFSACLVLFFSLEQAAAEPGKPTLTVDKSTVAVGTSVTFTCTKNAADTTNPTSYKLFKGAVTTPVKTGTSDKLVITAAATDNNVDYTCKTADAKGDSPPSEKKKLTITPGSWDSIFCSTEKLTSEIKKDTATKAEYQRALTQWNNLDKTAKEEVAKMIKDKALKAFAAAKIPKIPGACLSQLPLADITVDQIMEIAKLGNVLTMTAAIATLDNTKKATLFGKVKTAATALSNEVQRALGNALLTNVVGAASGLACQLLLGAMTNSALTKSNYKTLIKAFGVENCEMDQAIAPTIAAKVVPLYSSVTKIDSLTSSSMKEMKPLLASMSAATCEVLFTDDRVKDSFSTATKLKTLKLQTLNDAWKVDKCGDQSSPCLTRLANLLVKKPTSITAESWSSLGTVASFIPFANFKTQWGSEKTKSEETAFKDMAPYVYYEGRGYATDIQIKEFVNDVVETVKPAKGVTDWSTVTEDDLKTKYKGYIPFLPIDKLKKITQAKLCNAAVFDAMKSTIQYGKSFYITEACKKQLDVTKPLPKQKSCMKDKPEGIILTSMVTSKIKQISDVKKAFGDASNIRVIEGMSTADACYLVDKALQADPNLLTTMMKSPVLTKCITAETIASKAKTKSFPRTLANSNLNLAQQAAIYATQVTKDKPIGKLTDAEISDLLPVVPAVITAEMVKKMTAGTPVIAKALSKRNVAGKVSQAVIDAVLLRMKSLLAVTDDKDPLKAMTLDQANNLGSFIIYIKDPATTLKNAKAEVKKRYCAVMSEQMSVNGGCRKLPDLSKAFAFCKDLNAKGVKKWTAANVASMGNLACRLSATDITDMDDAQFKNAIVTFSGCQVMEKATKDAYVAKVKKTLKEPKDWTSTSTTPNFLQLGGTLQFFSEADLKTIKKAEFAKVTIGLDNAECIKTKYGIEDKGYSNLVKALKEVLSKSSSSRRKRTTQTWTYATLSLYPDSFLKEFTKEDIKAIVAADFGIMYKRLADIPGWPKETATALLTRIKGEEGVNKKDLCKFTGVELINTGFLVLKMTDDDIKCLKFTDDNVSPLTNQIGWSSDQYTKLAEKYTTDKTLKLESIKKSGLLYLGSFLCGKKKDEIEKIPPKVLKESFSAVSGLYVNCDKTKLVGLLTVALKTDCFGPIDKWTRSNIAAAGVTLSAITKEQIKAMGANAADIPVNVLKKLDKDVLNAMTKEAKDKLPDNVKKDLDVKDGTAGFPTLSGVLLLLTLLFHKVLY